MKLLAGGQEGQVDKELDPIISKVLLRRIRPNTQLLQKRRLMKWEPSIYTCATRLH